MAAYDCEIFHPWPVIIIDARLHCICADVDCAEGLLTPASRFARPHHYLGDYTLHTYSQPQQSCCPDSNSLGSSSVRGLHTHPSGVALAWLPSSCAYELHDTSEGTALLYTRRHITAVAHVIDRFRVLI